MFQGFNYCSSTVLFLLNNFTNKYIKPGRGVRMIFNINQIQKYFLKFFRLNTPIINAIVTAMMI